MKLYVKIITNNYNEMIDFRLYDFYNYFGVSAILGEIGY